MEEYGIMVHGMKSASGSIGIIPLSGMAAVLEKSADRKDKDAIEKMHDVFIREWKEYKDALRDYLN